MTHISRLRATLPFTVSALGMVDRAIAQTRGAGSGAESLAAEEGGREDIGYSYGNDPTRYNEIHDWGRTILFGARTEF